MRTAFMPHPPLGYEGGREYGRQFSIWGISLSFAGRTQRFIFSHLLQPATLSISNGGVETLKLVDESNEATSNVNIYDRQNSAVEQKRNTRLNSNKSLLDDDSDDEVRQDDRRLIFVRYSLNKWPFSGTSKMTQDSAVNKFPELCYLLKSENDGESCPRTWQTC